MTPAELARALADLDAQDRARFERLVLQGARGRLLPGLLGGETISADGLEQIEEEATRATAFVFGALSAREEGGRP